jgi:hypothetical protein
MNFDKNTLYILVEITVPNGGTMIKVYFDVHPSGSIFDTSRVRKVIHATAPPPPRVLKTQPLTARLFVTNGIDVKREITTSKPLSCTSNIALQTQNKCELEFHRNQCTLYCSKNKETGSFSFKSLYMREYPPNYLQIMKEVDTLKRPRDEAETMLYYTNDDIKRIDATIQIHEDGLRDAKRRRIEAEDKRKECEKAFELIDNVPSSLYLPLNKD